MRKWLGVGIALVVAAILGIFAIIPPVALGADAPGSAFSAGRAMADVRKIAAAPHPTGSEENAKVRGYLAGRMRGLGMEVSVEQGLISAVALERLNRWSGRQDREMPLFNLIGVLPGQDRALPAVLLMAHHDSVWGSPGAPDDSAGVAASLEIVRAIKARGQPLRDVVVLFTDGEELGLEGAKLFFAQNPLRTKIGAVINLEARGGGGRASLFQTSAQNGEAAAIYASTVSRPAASSLAAYVYSVLPNNTDLTPALDQPYTSYNIAFIGRPGLYHSPLATADRLDQGSLQDMGQQALDLTAALASAKALPGKARDAVFFDVFGLFTAIWPSWVSTVLLILAIGAGDRVIRASGTKGLVEGAARMLALLFGAAVLFYLFNRLSTGFGPGEYYDRLAAIPRLEVIAALVAAASFLLVFGRTVATPPMLIGGALPLLLLAIPALILAPTASYILAVPLFLFGLAVWKPRLWLMVTVTALVIGYMIALGHQLMEGVGPDLPMVAALPLALAALTLLPIWPGLEKRTQRTAIAAFLVSAAGVALWVHLDAPAESRAVYAINKR